MLVLQCLEALLCNLLEAVEALLPTVSALLRGCARTPRARGRAGCSRACQAPSSAQTHAPGYQASRLTPRRGRQCRQLSALRVAPVLPRPAGRARPAAPAARTAAPKPPAAQPHGLLNGTHGLQPALSASRVAVLVVVAAFPRRKPDGDHDNGHCQSPPGERGTQPQPQNTHSTRQKSPAGLQHRFSACTCHPDAALCVTRCPCTHADVSPTPCAAPLSCTQGRRSAVALMTRIVALCMDLGAHLVRCGRARVPRWRCDAAFAAPASRWVRTACIGAPLALTHARAHPL
jgi:hypothetical protein